MATHIIVACVDVGPIDGVRTDVGSLRVGFVAMDLNASVLREEEAALTPELINLILDFLDAADAAGYRVRMVGDNVALLGALLIPACLRYEGFAFIGNSPARACALLSPHPSGLRSRLNPGVGFRGSGPSIGEAPRPERCVGRRGSTSNPSSSGSRARPWTTCGTGTRSSTGTHPSNNLPARCPRSPHRSAKSPPSLPPRGSPSCTCFTSTCQK